MLFLLFLCCASAFVATALLLRYGRGHSRRYANSMPQRFHAGHVPRLGGVGMLVACTVGWCWMVLSQQLNLGNQIRIDPLMAVALWIVVTLAVAAGAYEDLTQRLPARYRLLLTVGAAVLAVWLLKLWVPRLGVAPVDALWSAYPWIGVALAVFAVSGLPHAFNLIDGYNGLAGIVALVCCFALAYVSLQVGDRQLAAMVLVLAGATAGFLVWNYPRGLIFAGDGGAYLWGVVIAIASIQLVMRHGEVSPWFPILLLIYPVWETMFSIYRKAVRGQSPGVADALHFHQLIYRRIVRGVFHDDEARRMLMRNNRTSPYLWGFALLTVLPAVMFWNHTGWLMAFSALFVVSYVWAYTSIIRFKVPSWLRR
ncbi:MraY family glycosyltransferase [Caenimonas aquaedulcis]|uniref:Glycosyltransferase family 4 protein n=1 Tax=Caenimonas aquaedulcis TaxID=2793270 RepID=A0A931H7F7_9BURK|nr:glycosyltransferase [Caenimonas aquaedulcis]MBG9389812.1 glycosyltransferase family 4 protein [Caenimonas aquaedulcis]